MDSKQSPPLPVSDHLKVPPSPEPFSWDRVLNLAVLVLGSVLAVCLIVVDDDVFSFVFLALAFTTLMIVSWCFDACAKSPERPFKGMWLEVSVWSLVASVTGMSVFMFPAASELMSPYLRHLVTFGVSMFCSAFCYRLSKKRGAAAAASLMEVKSTYPEILYELHKPASDEL